jgi:transcriptional regulator with PAS, ATPase and Fis domain
LFEAAHGGTIFLDEISNTSSGLQAKLLRVIQEREVRRIGETKGRTVDVRVIVATNTSLEALVQQRLFRQDLLYRLKVLHIKVPPLRNRREDIPLLAENFVDKLNAAQRSKKYATPKFIENLAALTYPGNVRELQNVVERSYVFAKGTAITAVAADPASSNPAPGIDEVQRWFKELSEGRKDFWSEIHEPYKRRDISREKIVALIDLGLRTTRGNYKTMASLFKLKDKDYRRFMDFLRRGDCLLDFRPYRKMAQ